MILPGKLSVLERWTSSSLQATDPSLKHLHSDLQQSLALFMRN